jgi:hypothetical protein
VNDHANGALAPGGREGAGMSFPALTASTLRHPFHALAMKRVQVTAPIVRVND